MNPWPPSDTAEPAPPPKSGNIEDFIQSSFPNAEIGHFYLRMALREVMTSQWKVDNERELDEQMLLQFAKQSEDSKWHCLFHKDSKPCGSANRRKEHTKNHIRTHIEHLPFACSGDWYVSYRIYDTI